MATRFETALNIEISGIADLILQTIEMHDIRERVIGSLVYFLVKRNITPDNLYDHLMYVSEKFKNNLTHKSSYERPLECLCLDSKGVQTLVSLMDTDVKEAKIDIKTNEIGTGKSLMSLELLVTSEAIEIL